MLYVAFGDGGPQKRSSRPLTESANLSGFHVADRRRSDAIRGLPYAIPPDNPFLECPSSRTPPIRPGNVGLRFSGTVAVQFRLTRPGELYVGDVGQDSFEEVSLVRRGRESWLERPRGDMPHFPTSTVVKTRSRMSNRCSPTSTDLGFSVTGGFVYRGQGQSDSFQGVYIFGDYNTRRVWAIAAKGGRCGDQVVEIGTAPGGIASFGRRSTGRRSTW